MKNRHRRKRRAGFTLLEVLLVLAILGVIAAMVVPQLLGQQKKAYIEATKASIHGLESALKLYALAHDGEYPQGSQDALALLMENVDEEGEAVEPLLDKLPTDAWGQLFFYEFPNNKVQTTKPAIWSSGPDKQNDDGSSSSDDVNNWDDLLQL